MNKFKWIFFGLIIIILSTGVNAKVDYISGINCDGNEGSMYPYIDCTDRNYVLVKTNTVTNNDDIEVGNVYIYTPNRKYYSLSGNFRFVHRLWKIENNLYYFQGDNNWWVDHPIDRKYIALKVIEVIK